MFEGPLAQKANFCKREMVHNSLYVYAPEMWREIWSDWLWHMRIYHLDVHRLCAGAEDLLLLLRSMNLLSVGINQTGSLWLLLATKWVHRIPVSPHTHFYYDLSSTCRLWWWLGNKLLLMDQCSLKQVEVRGKNFQQRNHSWNHQIESLWVCTNADAQAHYSNLHLNSSISHTCFPTSGSLERRMVRTREAAEADKGGRYHGVPKGNQVHCFSAQFILTLVIKSQWTEHKHINVTQKRSQSMTTVLFVAEKRNHAEPEEKKENYPNLNYYLFKMSSIRKYIKERKTETLDKTDESLYPHTGNWMTLPTGSQRCAPHPNLRRSACLPAYQRDLRGQTHAAKLGKQLWQRAQDQVVRKVKVFK